MKVKGEIITQTTVKEGEYISLQTPDKNRETLTLKTATWAGDYAVIKNLNGNVYDYLFRPHNRKTWELLTLEIRYGKAQWQRHISPYKV